MINLSQIAADLKAHFESVEETAKAFLEAHIPGVTEVAEKLESDPLVQAVMAAALPDPVRAMLAEMVTKLAAEFPPPPAPEPAPAPADPPPAG